MGMETRAEYLHLGQKIYHRPRVTTQLQIGLFSPLTTVVAGPGYGKTTAVASFVELLSYPLVWLNLCEFDNEIPHFWKTVEAAVRRELPEYADVFSRTTFPDTMAAFIQLHNSVHEVDWERPQNKVVIVLDNYDFIYNEQVLLFLSRCLSLHTQQEPVKLHYIFISNERLEGTQNPFHYHFFKNIGEVNRITAADLAFQPEEVQGLFALYDKSLTEDQLDDLMEKTAGWPIVLYLNCIRESGGNVQSILSELFENQQFQNYEPDFQLLLIKLSMLPCVPLRIISQLTNLDLQKAIQQISQNVFIDYAYETKLFYFQTMYQRFLQSKAELIAPEEQRRIYNQAADIFFARGMHSEARNLYIRAQNYDRFIECLTLLFPLYHGVSYTNSLQQHLLQIPTKYRLQNPWADYHLAITYLNDAQIHHAKDMLCALLQRLESNRKQHRQIIGEICLTLSDISLMQNTMESLTYIQEAAECIPSGSIVVDPSTYTIEENSIFFLPLEYEQSVPEIIDYIYEVMSYRSMFSNKTLDGYNYLFDAEGSFAICDMIRAENSATQAVFQASLSGIHEIVLNGYYILMRIACYRGNYQIFTDLLQQFHTYCNDNDTALFSELQDILLAPSYMIMDNEAEIASWIREINLHTHDEKPLWKGRNILACALYLLYKKDYLKAITILSQLDPIFQQRGVWSIRLCAYTIQAIAYANLNNTEMAIRAFQKVYDMVYPYAVFCPLIEFGQTLLPVITLVRQNKSALFPDLWLSKVEQEAARYARHILQMQKAYAKDHPQPQTYVVRLTQKEKHVVFLLSQGLTRAEIAKDMRITVNGVKKYLSSIYLKLGAKNRADAVYIATQNNII